MIFHSPANKTYFHKKGCALVLFWKWGFLELGSGLLKGLARDRNMNFGINRFWNFENSEVKHWKAAAAAHDDDDDDNERSKS